MGKRLIQQRRGRTKSKFNAPSHRYKGKIKYSRKFELTEGVVIDILHDPGRTAPVAYVKLKNNKIVTILAPEGIKNGDRIKFTDKKMRLLLEMYYLLIKYLRELLFTI